MKAVAGELNRKHRDISLTEIRDSLAGESEKNVKRVFVQAKEHQPYLIIIDEVDALIQQRGSDDLSAGMRQLVSQFLRDIPSLKEEDVHTPVVKGEVFPADAPPAWVVRIPE